MLLSKETEVLTVVGFQKIHQLDTKVPIIVINDDEKYEKIEDYKVINGRGFVHRFSVNGRFIVSTRDVSEKAFFSTKYSFISDSEEVIAKEEIQLDDRSFQINYKDYILLGFLLFDNFTYDDKTETYTFCPTGNDKDDFRIINNLELALNRIGYYDCIKLLDYYGYGEAFTFKTDFFGSILDYLYNIIELTTKNFVSILKVLEEIKLVYRYSKGDSNKKTVYLNVRNVELAKVFCFLFNLQYGSSLLKEKGKDNYIICTVDYSCFKSDRKKEIKSFCLKRDVDSCEGDNIKIDSKKDYYLVTMNKESKYYNLCYLPPYDGEIE